LRRYALGTFDVVLCSDVLYGHEAHTAGWC
jgi:predicted nicotinamide N-methyase